MAFFTINDTLHQKHLFSITLCKYPSTLHTSNFHHPSHFLTFSPPKHSFSPKISPLFLVSSHVNHITGHEPSTRTVNFRTSRETSSRDKRVGGKSVEQGNVSLVEEEEIGKRFTNDVYTKKMVGSRNRREMGSGLSSMRSKYASSEVNSVETSNISLVNGNKMNKTLRKVDRNSKVGEKKMQRVSKKIPGELEWRVKLDMCSKRGDVMGAIDLFDEAMRKGIKMGQYHYTVLLYLCSWAAVGVVHPAKSGSGSRSLSLNALNSFNEVSTVGSVDFKEFRDMGKRDYNGSDSNSPHSGNRKVTELGKNLRDNGKELNSNRVLKEVAKDDLGRNSYEEENSIQFSEFTSANPKIIDGRTRKGDNDSANLRNGNADQEKNEILVSEDIKKYALQRGFDIYEMMRLEKVPMNEATLTSVARMAMSMGDGDMAFDMVNQMKTLGIDPRLRSYDPALSAYCKSGDSDKAFAVEKHMLEHGVHPEEPELEALLSVSIEAGKSDKVYYLLHKLRSSVRKVSPSTADLIEKWFKGKEASRVGKRKWDKKLIRQAIHNGGGGWHGQGWLGQGKWTVTHTTVADDGLCKCCEEKLTTIDLDPTETENFAESVASIAARREKHSSFQKFQKWLDYYGPFEAVVDAANVGLFSQKRFIPSKINAVVNGIRQMLPSKKWPLIILHNRRVTGNKMDEPLNKALVEKWKIADALYATPTGSNDDWYWLYAAIKFKCLLVTNDEMRDHTFQLLGNDFFPKWKERHQVHFDFSDSGPIFHMPPPCSVVIQESESGHWHIPIASENDSEGERTWLCITRSNSDMKKQGSTTRSRGSDTHDEVQTQGSREVSRNPQQDNYTNLRTILSESVFSSHPTSTILSEIEVAEVLGNCTIDFQI